MGPWRIAATDGEPPRNPCNALVEKSAHPSKHSRGEIRYSRREFPGNPRVDERRAVCFVRGMTETPQSPLLHFDLTQIVIGAFFETYNELGGGFPEKVLNRALAIAIRAKGLTVIEKMELPVWFRGRSIVTFEADLVVARKLIVEVKAAPEILDFHRAQLLHYLKATDIEVGLVVNFGREPKFRRQVYENSRKLRHFPEPTPEELESTFQADGSDKSSA